MLTIAILAYFIIGILIEDKRIKPYTESSKIAYFSYLIFWLPAYLFSFIIQIFIFLFRKIKPDSNNTKK